MDGWMRNSRHARIAAELLFSEPVLLDEEVEPFGLFPHVVKRNTFCHGPRVHLAERPINTSKEQFQSS